MANLVFTMKHLAPAVGVVDTVSTEGVISMPGWRGMGRPVSMAFSFTTEFAVQALVSDFTGFFGYAALTTTLIAEFTPGTGSPDFDTTVVESINASAAVFVGSFGFGLPFTYGYMIEGPVTSTGAIPRQDFQIEVQFAGLNSPTYNGAPTFAATPMNQAEAGAFVVYEVAPVLGTNRADDMKGTRFSDAVSLLGGNDIFRAGAGDDIILGGAGNDTLYGEAGHDRLLGGNGDDVLYGGPGNDTLLGGAGNDKLYGGAGANQLRGDAGNDSLYGHASRDLLDGGAGNDLLMGMAGNDRLTGGAGRDTLDGGAGKDTLDGGTDADILTGGADADIFLFTSVNDSPGGQRRDVITDFERGVDRIDLRKIDANEDLAGDQAFKFGGTKAAANSLWYAKSGKGVILRADTDGDARPDFTVLLQDLDALSATDIML